MCIFEGDVSMEIVENGIRYLNSGTMRVLGFANGYQTKELEIPDMVDGEPVVEIAPNAFKDTDIESVILPSTLAIIGMSAFESCQYLKTVSIDNLDDFSRKLHIKAKAFRNCLSLESIDAWCAMTNIDSSAFAGCCLLQFVGLSLKIVYAKAFQHCPKLQCLNFHEEAVLFNGCLENCDVKELCMVKTATIQPQTLGYIFDKNIKMYCVKNSNLLELIYDGFNIELYDEDEEELLSAYM